MSSFAIKFPFFILLFCLMVVVVGTATVTRMPVDLFPEINIPVVVVATFTPVCHRSRLKPTLQTAMSGSLRWAVESTISSRGRYRASASSRSTSSREQTRMQPSATYRNLAMANLRRLPPGTLPPVVLKFDASNLPVCLVTLEGQGLNQTQLKDLAQFSVRNQIATVAGASVPQPYGGKYRQIQVYVDPVKLEAHQLSVMDVVRSVNESNLILPAGDVRIGTKDYNIYANSQIPVVQEINAMPIKTDKQDHIGESILVGDVGKAVDARQL